tara:strand:- start:10404 stop:11069 length:666 start_codon:yes stop_codon:yes gene_type:complete
MADVRITNLTELSTSANDDFLLIHDTSAGQTKKIKASEFKQFGNSEVFTRYNAYPIRPESMVAGMFTFSITGTSNRQGVQVVLTNPPSDFPSGTALVFSGIFQDNGTGERFTEDDSIDPNFNNNMDYYFSRNFPILTLKSGETGSIGTYDFERDWDVGRDDNISTRFGATGRLTGVRIFASFFETSSGFSSFAYYNDLDPDVDVAVSEQVFRYQDSHTHDD